MTNEKNKVKEIENTEKKELNLEELEQVTGGSIRDVKYTQTTEISEDTKKKI